LADYNIGQFDIWKFVFSTINLVMTNKNNIKRFSKVDKYLKNK